jgi:mannose-6-phosphate isomerase-like protein (cupin superfamily)
VVPRTLAIEGTPWHAEILRNCTGAGETTAAHRRVNVRDRNRVVNDVGLEKPRCMLPIRGVAREFRTPVCGARRRATFLLNHGGRRSAFTRHLEVFVRIEILAVLTTIVTMSPMHLRGLQGQDLATDITAEEIQTVADAIGNQIDLQIKVAEISQGNVAVGVLHRDRVENTGGPATGLVHRAVSEVYYILSGGRTLVTGGTVSAGPDLPADIDAVTVLVGPTFRASAEGGRVREISEGDVVVIPAGVFHAWSEIPDHVTYLSIRPDPHGTLPAGYVNPLIGGPSEN